MRFIIRILINAAALWLTAWLLPAFELTSNILGILVVAIVFGLVNALIRPIVKLLSLPITILTLGLFTFVINALMLKLASGVIPGFNVYGFWTAVIGSLIISIISWLLNSFISDQGSVSYIRVGRHAHHSRTVKRHDSDDTIDLENKGDDRWE